MYDNPKNQDVRGIKSSEIHELFPEFSIDLWRITLAPPLARKIPKPMLPFLYPLLSAIPILRTHYLGLFLKPG
jgi:hypothetical protein